MPNLVTGGGVSVGAKGYRRPLVYGLFAGPSPARPLDAEPGG